MCVVGKAHFSTKSVQSSESALENTACSFDSYMNVIQPIGWAGVALTLCMSTSSAQMFTLQTKPILITLPVQNIYLEVSIHIV